MVRGMRIGARRVRILEEVGEWGKQRVGRTVARWTIHLQPRMFGKELRGQGCGGVARELHPMHESMGLLGKQQVVAKDWVR